MSASAGRFRDLLGDEVWGRLARHGATVRYAGGETVLRRGDPPTRVFVVTAGQFDVVDPRTSPATVLASRGVGHVLGEMSFVDGSPVSAEVRASGATEAVELELGRLRSALAADPLLDAAFHRALSAVLGSRIRSLTTSVVTGGLAASTSTGPLALPGDGDALLDALLRPSERRTFVPDGHRATLGRDPGCDVVLDDPRLARVHAELVLAEEGWRVVSRDGRAVAVNRAPVASAAVPDGAVISVGRFEVVHRGAGFEIGPAGPAFALRVDAVRRQVGARTLLHDVSFTLLAGEVVALVGPSGAGKTTLLGALSGSSPPDGGTVAIGAVPLADALASRPTLVAEVPQDDIVLPELTVEESLRFTARLRVGGLDAAAREARVNGVIGALGLDAVRGSRIGDPEARGISGGQRKRVNIGQELLSDDTRVLFLDEPTSGLDPQATEDVARLARRLADAGRIVVLVTHDLGDGLLGQVDHLVVMAPGGHLAWFGPVRGALEHFRVDAAPKIFGRLADAPGAVWGERYRASPAAATWVGARAGRLSTDPLGDGLPAPLPAPGMPSRVRALVERGALAKVRDRTAVAVLAGQPALVALVSLLVFPRTTAGAVFLLTLASFWFGMSAAVRELVADRVVWWRERRTGVPPLAWVGAKTLVTGTLVAAQCASCTLVVAGGVGLGPGASLAGLVAAEVLTGQVGTAVGLLVSSLWRRSDAAVGTIVLLLVPQIAFVGVLTPLDHVGIAAAALSWVTPLRYAFHLALLQAGELAYLDRLGEWQPRPVSGELYALGLRPPGEDGLGLPVPALVGALVGFAAVGFAAAVIRMRRA